MALGRGHRACPTVVLGIAASADPTIALALGFAAGGAVIGWAIRRVDDRRSCLHRAERQRNVRAA